jgi:biopolymer transport protein ExbB/biopolymer transport protein TolQ
MNLDFAEIWAATPVFGKFLWAVLAFMSVWSLSVGMSKVWQLRRSARTVKSPRVSQFLEEDNLGEAIKLAESYKKSHVARVLGGALAEVKPLIMDGSVTVADINTAERAVEREMLMEMVSLKRGLAVLATVGSTAPFVGLLGTVFGIINAFEGMAKSGRVVSPPSPPVSPRRSSRRPSVSASPFRPCGRSTTSRRRSTTSRPR